jgi:hypothetical protein
MLIADILFYILLLRILYSMPFISQIIIIKKMGLEMQYIKYLIVIPLLPSIFIIYPKFLFYFLCDSGLSSLSFLPFLWCLDLKAQKMSALAVLHCCTVCLSLSHTWEPESKHLQHFHFHIVNAMINHNQTNHSLSWIGRERNNSSKTTTTT